MKIIVRVLLVSLLVLAVLGGVGFKFIQELSTGDEDRISEVAEGIVQQEETTEDVEASEQEEGEMKEGEVQTYLHRMTHQKIVAEEKRGAIEMSPQNIQNMLTIVRENAGNYEHSDFYEESLTAWEQGDFSNAVTVHNTIWNWHDGTVGKATGLMTPQQEADYVNENFK